MSPYSDVVFFFFSSRRRHTRWNCDWSSDVCSSDLVIDGKALPLQEEPDALRVDDRDASDLAPHPSRPRLQPDRCGRLGKIGRASCRERVEISVVAVALNEKKAE